MAKHKGPSSSKPSITAPDQPVVEETGHEFDQRAAAPPPDLLELPQKQEVVLPEARPDGTIRARVTGGTIKCSAGGIVFYAKEGDWVTLSPEDFKDCRHQLETETEANEKAAKAAELAALSQEGHVDPWFEEEKKRAVENEKKRREANAAAQLQRSQDSAKEAFGMGGSPEEAPGIEQRKRL